MKRNTLYRRVIIACILGSLRFWALLHSTFTILLNLEDHSRENSTDVCRSTFHLGHDPLEGLETEVLITVIQARQLLLFKHVIDSLATGPALYATCSARDVASGGRPLVRLLWSAALGCRSLGLLFLFA